MKFSRTFSASVGDKSIGTAGPDQIEYDLDQIALNLDPTQTGGGITDENLGEITAITEKVTYKTDDIKYIRLNADDAIEVSADNINWTVTGSSGHIILDQNGTQMIQRARMKFANSTVTDDGTQTVVQGLTGPQGPTGATGPKGDTGAKGDTGNLGPVIVPSIDTNGVMSFTIQETAIAPNPVSVRGPQGPQGVQGAQGAQGATGSQGVQGVQGSQGIQGEKGDDGADGRSFTVLSLYATLLALQTAHPTGSAGDAYAVGTAASNVIYIWDTVGSAWLSIGAMQGVKGEKGDQGIQGVQGEQGIQGVQGVAGTDGESAYEAAVAGGFSGTESAFDAALAEMPGLAGTGRTTETIKGNADAIAAHEANLIEHGEGTLNLYRANKDAYGVYVTLQWKRTDATLAKQSVLSGGTAPNYTTRTVTYYDTDGTTVLATKTYTLSYTGSDVISEVLS